MDDAAFIMALLNESSFIEHIGDKGVRSLDDAQRYLLDGPIASYERHGFGLWRDGLKADDTPIGMAGLLKRDSLDDVDLGFAFLAHHCGRGYAHEVTSSIMTHARTQLGLGRVVAIVSEGNTPSIKLLGKLGFTFERLVQLDGSDQKIPLYASIM